MNDIILINNHKVTVKEFNGQRVVTFKDIDMVHERPDGTAKRSFNENKKRFVENEDFFTIPYSEFCTKYVPNPQKGGNPNVPVTLITEQGYLMLVKPFGDDLAWDVQRKLVKSYFTKIKSFSTAEQIQLLARGHVELESRIDCVEHKLEDFKNDMPLLAVEIEKITDAVKKKGISVLGGKRSNAYNDSSLRSRLYQDMHRDVRRQFGVSTYKAIKRNQCDKAIQIILRYEPPMYLKEQIDDTNAQMNIDD